MTRRGGLQLIVETDFAGQVLPFDDEAARHYAEIVAGREGRGHP